MLVEKYDIKFETLYKFNKIRLKIRFLSWKLN